MAQAVFQGAGRQPLCLPLVEQRIDVLALERASLHLVEPRVTQLAGHQRQGALPVGLCGEAAVTVASAQLFQRPGQIIHRLPPVSWV